MVVIECTKNQALLIEISLDILSRLVAGQIHKLVDGVEIIGNKNTVIRLNESMINKIKKALDELIEDAKDDEYGMSGYRLGSHIQNLIKPLLFPELHINESYGVGNKELGDAQILYEMCKKLQNFRARNFKNAGTLSLEPLHYSKEPLIKVYERKE